MQGNNNKVEAAPLPALTACLAEQGVPGTRIRINGIRERARQVSILCATSYLPFPQNRPLSPTSPTRRSTGLDTDG